MDMDNYNKTKKYYINKQKFNYLCENKSNSQNLLDDFFFQKESGNLGIAKILGKELGKSILKINSNFKLNRCKIFEDNKKILFVFASISALEYKIKNEYILASSKNSLLNYLELKDEKFYNFFNNSIAISFYILCKRMKKKDYGKYFSLLCNDVYIDKNKNDLIKIGNLFYIIFFNLALNKIKKYIFKT